MKSAAAWSNWTGNGTWSGPWRPARPLSPSWPEWPLGAAWDRRFLVLPAVAGGLLLLNAAAGPEPVGAVLAASEPSNLLPRSIGSGTPSRPFGGDFDDLRALTRDDDRADVARFEGEGGVVAAPRESDAHDQHDRAVAHDALQAAATWPAREVPALAPELSVNRRSSSSLRARLPRRRRADLAAVMLADPRDQLSELAAHSGRRRSSGLGEWGRTATGGCCGSWRGGAPRPC